jgi:effector-binding domain-containing protein
MKIFRRILLIILCIALIFAGIGFILPRKVHVERKLLLNATQKTIFSQITTLKNWAKWSPWLQVDTTMKLIFSGPESGVGSSLSWLSNNIDVGKGRLSIISNVSPESVEVVYDFHEKGKSIGKFLLIKENQNTNVTFSVDSDLGMNPVSRWFGLFSDHMIGPDMEQTLLNLDEYVQNSKVLYGYEITNFVMPARILISVRDTCSPETVILKLSMMYKKLSLFLKSKSLSPIGNPIAVFHNFTNRNFDIEAGLPVRGIVSVPEGLNCYENVDQRTVMIKFIGSYKTISTAYKALQTYVFNNDLQMNGPGWEEYITNPIIEADSSMRQTNIYYPIR